MVAFSFELQFVKPIRADIKVQTIRRNARCKPGDPMHLYTGMRTKACELIAVRPAVVVDYCHIAPEGLTLGDVRKHPRNRDEFAQLDGFADFDAMLRWFEQRYGSSRFIGVVHRWATPPARSAGEKR